MIADGQAKSIGASSPSPNGSIGGRDGSGRFARGNAGGPGNPLAKRVAAFRSMILEAVTEDDLRAVVVALIEKAKGGDVMAARELLDRLVGKSAAPVLLDLQDIEERKLRLAEDRANDQRWGKN